MYFVLIFPFVKLCAVTGVSCVYVCVLSVSLAPQKIKTKPLDYIASDSNTSNLCLKQNRVAGRDIINISSKEKKKKKAKKSNPTTCSVIASSTSTTRYPIDRLHKCDNTNQPQPANEINNNSK